jgi:hypothetical protein
MKKDATTRAGARTASVIGESDVLHEEFKYRTEITTSAIGIGMAQMREATGGRREKRAVG